MLCQMEAQSSQVLEANLEKKWEWSSKWAPDLDPKRWPIKMGDISVEAIFEEVCGCITMRLGQMVGFGRVYLQYG